MINNKYTPSLLQLRLLSSPSSYIVVHMYIMNTGDVEKSRGGKEREQVNHSHLEIEHYPWKHFQRPRERKRKKWTSMGPLSEHTRSILIKLLEMEESDLQFPLESQTSLHMAWNSAVQSWHYHCSPHVAQINTGAMRGTGANNFRSLATQWTANISQHD